MMSAEEKPREEKLEFVELPFVPVYHVTKNGEIVLHLESIEEFEKLKKKMEEEA